MSVSKAHSAPLNNTSPFWVNCPVEEEEILGINVVCLYTPA